MEGSICGKRKKINNNVRLLPQNMFGSFIFNSSKFTLCTTGGTDLGNLLQGGEAYVKFFAENAHFQGRSDCAPEYQSNTPRQETN